MAEPQDRAAELSEQAAELARQLVAERFPEGTGPRTLAEMEEALAEVKQVLGERLQRLSAIPSTRGSRYFIGFPT